MTAFVEQNVWGFVMPAGIISGYWMAVRRARQAGLETRELESGLQWAIGAGIVISHIVEMLFYQQTKLEAEGIVTLFKFWDGLSAYGALFGGALTLCVFYGLRRRSWWREADVLIQGLTLGWMIGRIGCAVSGDHPGPRWESFLAYSYPDGPRHNLGLYEMLFTALVIFPANLLLYSGKAPVGSFVVLDCLLYGSGRFALDFMRATDRSDSDPRYLGLTLAQYCSLAVFLFGLRALALTTVTPGGAARPAKSRRRRR